MELLKKLIMKKKEKEGKLDPKVKAAKMKVLDKVDDDMMSLMGGDLDKHLEDAKMQKVTVAAKDKEGLKKGLEKAEELMGMEPAEDEEAEEKDEDELESESIEDQIKKAEELLAQLKAKQ